MLGIDQKKKKKIHCTGGPKRLIGLKLKKESRMYNPHLKYENIKKIKCHHW